MSSCRKGIQLRELVVVVHASLLLALLMALIFVWTADHVLPVASANELGSKTRLNCEEILDALASRRDAELAEFLNLLGRDIDTSHLTDPQIDRILHRLDQIQKNDSYQVKSAKGGKTLVNPNRSLARSAAYLLECRKITNRLRMLPMEQRVAEIIRAIERPRLLRNFSTTEFYRTQLVAAGKDAVPFIIRHKQGVSFTCGVFVKTLEEIGDPRGVDYIIDVLRRDDENHQSARATAARALGVFRGEKVVSALIDALRDETFQDIVRNRTQTRVTPPGYEALIGKYYGVQHAASKSLVSVTGQDWGLLYNEDSKTWLAWLNSDDSEAFDPRSVERTEKDLRSLIKLLYHRYMSGRPNPWQPRNALASREGIRAISEDLSNLGRSVVPILVEECRSRITDTPTWKGELLEWTRKLLLSLPWKEATELAEMLEKESESDRKKPG